MAGCNWNDNPTSRGCCRTGSCLHTGSQLRAQSHPLLTSLSKPDQGAVHVWVLPPCQLHGTFDCCCLQQGPGLAAIHLGSGQLRLKVLGGSLQGRAPGEGGDAHGRSGRPKGGPHVVRWECRAQ